MPCTSGSRDYRVFVYGFSASVNSVIVLNSWEWSISSLRLEMLSKPPLVSEEQRVCLASPDPKYPFCYHLVFSVLLLKNSIGPISSLNDVHSFHQLFPCYPCLPLLWLFIILMVYAVPFISKNKTPV